MHQKPRAVWRPTPAARRKPSSSDSGGVRPSKRRGFHLVLVSPKLGLIATIRRRMRQTMHAITHTALNSRGGCQEAFVWDVQSVVQPLYHLQT
jgi:hypothetical protein